MNILAAVVCLLLCNPIFAYFDLQLTDGGPLIASDSKYINFDKLRVKKVNRTTHLLIGELETFKDFGNDFQV